MGVSYRAIENSRQPVLGQKTRRDFSLKFRFDLKFDERGRPCFGACFGPKEIKVAPDRAAAAERDLKRLEARIAHLYPSTILAVLNPCVMHLQLPFGGYDIIGAETFVKQISEDAKFPIIVGIINQSRLWKNAFQTELVGEKPDQSAAGGDYRTLIDRATHADDAEDFVFLERESHEDFPRNVDCIAPDIVLEIGSGIDLDTRAGMVVHDIFQSQQRVHSLEVIRQPVVGAAEIEPFVFNSCPEIPFAGDEEAMSVAKVVVERIAVAEVAVDVEEITASGVIQFVIKKFPMIFVRWRGRRLRLERRRAGDGGGGDTEKQADKEQ